MKKLHASDIDSTADVYEISVDDIIPVNDAIKVAAEVVCLSVVEWIAVKSGNTRYPGEIINQEEDHIEVKHM